MIYVFLSMIYALDTCCEYLQKKPLKAHFPKGETVRKL